MIVPLAVQVLSHTVSAAIKTAVIFYQLPENATNKSNNGGERRRNMFDNPIKMLKKPYLARPSGFEGVV